VTVIRAATVDDAAAIAEAHVASWHAAYAGLLPAEFLAAQSVESRTRRWREIVATDGGVMVVVDSGTVLGFASIGPSRDADVTSQVGELNAIYLQPEAWSTGAGHALHEAAMEALATAGYAEATLWVLDRNARAIRFYERHGWAPDGSAKDDVRDGVVLREVRFRRRL
jgi:L-amino acid N-acyltransferase YncA